jgi:predicted GH43/DUF377 family glycosyl hydrolase
MKRPIVLLFVLAFLLTWNDARGAVEAQQIFTMASNPWESSVIFRPSITYDGHSFMMWYSGENNAGIDRIGLATSTDGKSWVRYVQNPVLDVGPPGSWDSGSVNEAWVVLDGGQYRMWYSGQIYNVGTNQITSYEIGYATSADGIHWAKYSQNPDFVPGPSGSFDAQWVYRPIVLKTAAGYLMLYRGIDAQGYGNTGAATSDDGIHWNRISKITLSSTQWDAYYDSITGVLGSQGSYLAAYEGNAAKDGSMRIGFATSSDGIFWNPLPSNPTITYGPGSWDNLGVRYPMIVPINDQYYVYYEGYTNGPDSFGLSIIPASQFPVSLATATTSAESFLPSTTATLSSETASQLITQGYSTQFTMGVLPYFLLGIGAVAVAFVVLRRPKRRDMVYCPSCGRFLPPESKFCKNCGDEVASRKMDKDDNTRVY